MNDPGLTFTMLLITAALTNGEGSDKYGQAYLETLQVSQMAQALERRYLSERQRSMAGGAFFLTKLLVERKLELKFNF